MRSGLKEEECGQQTEGSYYVLPLCTRDTVSGILCPLLGFQFERRKECGESGASPRSHQEQGVLKEIFLVKFG